MTEEKIKRLLLLWLPCKGLQSPTLWSKHNEKETVEKYTIHLQEYPPYVIDFF